MTGDNRLTGAVYNRPGQADGSTIVTSPVVEVRMMGTPELPVAFTETGTVYWLEDPAAHFGLDKAEDFVWKMSGPQPRAAAGKGTQDLSLQTIVMQKPKL